MPVEGETRVVGNGIGTYKMVNGKLVFRITSMDGNKGKDNEHMKKLRDARNQKTKYHILSPRSAKIAFTEFYNNKVYKKSVSRKNKINNEVSLENTTNEKVENTVENKSQDEIFNKGVIYPFGYKLYKKRTVSPKYKKGSEEAKEAMKKLREAKEKKRLERMNEKNNSIEKIDKLENNN